MLVGDEVYEQHEPGTGEDFIHLFPWHCAWHALLDHPLSTLDRGKQRVGGVAR